MITVIVNPYSKKRKGLKDAALLWIVKRAP